MEYLIYLFVAFAVWILTRLLWRENHHHHQFMAKFPGPKGVISIWIVKTFLHKFNFLSIIIEFQRYYKSKNTCLWHMKHPLLITSDAEVISQICNLPALQSKSKLYTYIRDDFGPGLIFLSGDEWRHHRRAFNPAFNNSTVMSFIGKFNTGKDVAISEITQIADGNEHNLEHLILYVAAKTAFDTNFKTVLPKHEVYDYMKLSAKCMRQAEWRACWRFLNIPFFNYFNKNIDRDVFETRRPIRKIMNEKMESSTRGDAITSGNSDDLITKTPKVLVDQANELIKSKVISFEDAFAENVVIFSAAYETTGFTIFTVLVMLAMHPEVQERAFQEIVDIFPEKDFEVKDEHMQDLKYLDMVINETMRVCPPGPYILRDVAEDTPLKDGLTLPKGLQVLILIYNLHRDESLWGPDAGRFNPDHFLPENVKNRNPYAFMPFSKGARNCIGWRFAQLMMKIVLSGLIRNFKFSTDYKFEDLKFKNSVTMFYVEVPLLKIQRRK